jgi:hypothetical protein
MEKMMQQTEPTASLSPNDVPVRLEVITIHVNERPVTMTGRHQTGLDIKEAAIAQGVPIKTDFVLSVEHGDGHTKIVDDNETVTITEHSRFVAIDNDDNS